MPCSEETGSIMPENCTAGMIVISVVPKIAAIWLDMKVETSRPKAVANAT